MLSELSEWFGESSGELSQSDCQPGRVFGFDDTEHGFGLDQVDPAGEEGPQSEFTPASCSDECRLVVEQFCEQLLEDGF